MNLNRKQFLAAVRAGQGLLEELQGDYPELKLYPVLSRFGPRSGQCDLTTSLKKIVMGFPKMLGEGSICREGTHRSQKVGADRVRNAVGNVGHEDHNESQKEREDMSYNDISRRTSLPQRLRDLLFEIKGPVEKKTTWQDGGDEFSWARGGQSRAVYG